MDAILYLQAAKEEFSDLNEEAMIKRVGIIAQNGNTGYHYTTSSGDYETTITYDEKSI